MPAKDGRDLCWFDITEPRRGRHAAEVVLIQHEPGDDPDEWLSWTEMLSASYRVVRRGAPRELSTDIMQGAPTAIDQMAIDLSQFIRRHNFGKVHLLGRGSAAIVAIVTAANSPSCVKSLVTCGVPTSKLDSAAESNDPGYLHDILLRVCAPVFVMAPLLSTRATMEQQAQLAGFLHQASLLPINCDDADILGARAQECVTALRGFFSGIRDLPCQPGNDV